MMKYITCVCTLLIFTLVSIAQKEEKKFPLIEDIYNQWKKYHINIPHTACDTFCYAEGINPDILDDIKEFVKEKNSITRMVRLSFFRFSDTTNAEKIVFTQDEIDFIIKDLDEIKRMPWADSMFKDARLVPLKTIDTVLERVSAGKDSLLKKLCHTIHLFSVPTFLRHGTLCLFYFGERDVLGEKGEYWLYRKENGMWKEFAPVCRWFK
jgi:hypothetical protein